VPDDNSPATKQDLHVLSEEVHLLKQDLHDSLTALEDRLVEKMRDKQSELLRGFAAFNQA
jgi:hypothetical protein